MLTKWKKTIKFLATTIIVLIYVTTGLFNDPTLKDTGESKPPPHFALPMDKYVPTIRTVVGYSDEFRMRELEGRIDCEVGRYSGDGGGGRHDDHLGVQVFSAFYDQRQDPHNYVRVVALLRRNSSFYCQLCYDSNQGASCVTQKAFAHEIWSSSWGPKSTTCSDEYPAIVTCLAPSHNGAPAPSRVSFVDRSCSGGTTFLNVTNPVPPPRRTNFVVCVKPLDLTHLLPTTLLEWLDINLRLGADKIVLYGLNSTQRGSVVGKHLERRPLEWRELTSPQRERCPPSNFEDAIWHKRKMEIIAYNDCFYSNLYYTKFVIPLDVDEIIVPKTGNNWLEAFRSHFGKLSEGGTSGWPPGTDRYASFSVRNAYFFAEYPKDAILMLPKRKLPRKLVSAFRGGRVPPPEGIFGRTLRSYRLSPSSDSVKSFVHVAKTVSVFNHYAFHVLGEGTTRQLIFPENVFQLNHYRNSCDPVLIDGCREFLNRVVYDDSLEKFRKRGKERLLAVGVS